jgi:hypothetical protein
MVDVYPLMTGGVRAVDRTGVDRTGVESTTDSDDDIEKDVPSLP